VTLGATPGTNTIEARIAGVTQPVVFTATGLAGNPTAVTIVSGDSLIVQTFRRAGAPFVVELRDSAGFAVRNAPVTFAIVSGGGGTLSATTATTDTLGRASVFYTATGFVGTTSVTASVPNLPAATFTIQTVPTPPATVRALTAVTQTAQVGQNVPVAPVVELRDAQNNPVPGIQVLWNIVGGGAVQNTSSVTDSLGRATVGVWQVGAAAGEYVLSAVVSFPGEIPGNPVRFTATATTAAVNVTIEKQQGDLQTAAAGQNVAVQPGVIVRSGTTPLANVTVTFTTSGNGTATPQTVQTDANGVARTTWRLSTTAGTNTLVATVPNATAAAVFTATGQ
jgi:hypothetical protein